MFNSYKIIVLMYIVCNQMVIYYIKKIIKKICGDLSIYNIIIVNDGVNIETYFGHQRFGSF
jgi:hypothetical protein